jgi:hypothetical protein
MADEVISVRAVAQTAELEGGLGKSASIVESACDKMQAGFSRLFSSTKESMSGIATAVKVGVEKAEEPLTHFTERINLTAEHAQISARGIGNAFGGISSLLGAGLMVGFFAEFVHGAMESVIEMRNLAAQTGMTVEDLSRLKFAADMVDVSFDNVTIGLKKLAKDMYLARDGGQAQELAFTRLGISTKSWSTTLPPTIEVMEQVADRFHLMKDGAEKAALAQELFGRSGVKLIPLLNQGSAALREMFNESDKLGATLREDTVREVSKFDESIKRVSASMRGEGYSALNVLMEGLKRVAVVFELLQFVVMAVWDVIKNMFRSLTLDMEAFASVGKKLIAGDFAGAWAEAKKGADKLAGSSFDTLNSIADRAEHVQDVIGEMFAGDTKKGGVTGGDEDADKAHKKGKDDLVSQWEDQLNKIKLADTTFKQDEIARELEFWQQKLKLTTDGTENNRKVRAKVAELTDRLTTDNLRKELADDEKQMAALAKDSDERVKIANAEAAAVAKVYGKQSAEYERAQKHVEEVTQRVEDEKKRIREKSMEDQLKLLDSTTAAEEARAQGSAERERILAEQKLRMYNGTNNERLKIESDYEQKAYEAKSKALSKRRELLEKFAAQDPGNPKWREQLEKLNTETEKMNQQHDNKMLQIDTQFVTKKKQLFDGVFGAMSRAFQGSIQGMIQGTKTFAQAFADMGKAMLGAFIDMLVQMLMSWIEKHLAMMIFGKTTSQAEAQTAIGASAAEGGAAAGASVAHIPFVGWSMAPGVAASTFAMLNAYRGAALASARGGWDEVPEDQVAHGPQERDDLAGRACGESAQRCWCQRHSPQPSASP